jgi:hypothetical protein
MLAVADHVDGNGDSDAARHERERALLLARYRRVVLIGGPALGEQWRFTAADWEWTERDEQRRDVRARVRAGLARKLVDSGAEADRVAVLLAEPEACAGGAKDPILLELRSAFVEHALAELEQLKPALRRHSDLPGEASLALTETGLELTGECLRVRRDWIRGGGPREWCWTAEYVAELKGKVKKLENDGRLQRWHEHYNAACALALPLLVRRRPDAEPEETLRDDLAAEAVEHLQKATSCADSGYIATRRDWLLSEDPDLDGLRTHPRFKAFEAMYFPGPIPTPRRPRHVQRLEVSRYTRDLLDASARRWHAEWVERGRRDQLVDDPHELIRWWQDEAQAWTIVGRVAWNHRRWRARCDLLEIMDELSVRYGGTPLDVAFRAFQEPWTHEVTDDELDQRADEMLTAVGRQLQRLARELSDDPITRRFGIDAFEGWIDDLRDRIPDRAPVAPDTVNRLCGRHALLWDSLHRWVSAPDEAAMTEAAAKFSTQLRHLRDELGQAS